MVSAYGAYLAKQLPITSSNKGRPRAAEWESLFDDAQLLGLSGVNVFLIYLLVLVLQIHLADLVL